MRGILVNILSALLASASLSSCGPSLPPRISLPPINVKEVGEALPNSGGISRYVFVDEFIDSRGSRAIAVLEGKDIPSVDDVGPVVADGLKQALEKKGFVFSDTAPTVLSGEIRQWAANVSGGFSSKIDAEASLYVEILDPANKRIYAGVYNGFASIEGPSLGESDVKSALRTCLEEAIAQVTADRQLIKLISAF